MFTIWEGAHFRDARPIDLFVAHLDGVRGSRATCPACGRRGVLSFREGRDGKVLAYCFRHCTFDQIVAVHPLRGATARVLARTVAERRDREEAARREREAHRRDPFGYLRLRITREIGRVQAERRAEEGYYLPLRSIEVDVARRRIAASLGIGLRDVPPANGWPLWPYSGAAIAPEPCTTMPAPWEFVPHDTDPAWPGIFMAALERELEAMGLIDPEMQAEAMQNVWSTIPHALYRAARGARASIQSLIERDPA